MSGSVRQGVTVFVAFLVLAAGALVFLTGLTRASDAEDDVAAGRAEVAAQVAADRTSRRVDRHLAQARRVGRELSGQTGDVLAASSATARASRQLLAAQDALVLALQEGDYAAYNREAAAARVATEARADAQAVYSGDAAQLNGLIVQINDAVSSARGVLESDDG